MTNTDDMELDRIGMPTNDDSQLLKEINKASSPSNLVDINSENYIYKRIWKDGYAKGLTKLLDYVKIKE